MRSTLDILLINGALDALADADAQKNEEWFWVALRPLVEALKDGDKEAVADALLFERIDDTRSRQREAKWLAKDIATRPERYGLGEVGKSDVINLVEVLNPDAAETIPRSKDGRWKWWQQIEASIDQVRKYPTSELNEAIDRAKQLREWRQKRSAEFIEKGTMEVGDLRFELHPNEDASGSFEVKITKIGAHSSSEGLKPIPSQVPPESGP